MFKNYLKIAYRNLRREKGFAAVNIFGLAAGMAVCLLIFLFIRHQWKYDRWHDEAENIYRITSIVEGQRYAASPPPIGPALKADYVGIEEVVRMDREGAMILREENSFYETALYVDSSFFRVFDFQLTRGEVHAALDEPYSAVLTETLAEKVFGATAVIGKTLTLQNVGDFEITGILAKPPGPTHLEFNLFLSYATREGPDLTDWSELENYYSYVLLNEDLPAERVEAHLADIAGRFYSTEEQERWSFQLQPLTNITLGPGILANEIQMLFVPAFLAYILGALALIILFAAAFNYVNLTIVRSLARSKEIGVRKTLGAHRLQLAGQFLCEAVLSALIALVISVLLLKMLAPAFNSLFVIELFDAAFTFSLIDEPSLFLLLVGFAVVVGLLAGSYPALVLSRPDPAGVLKGQNQMTIWRGLFSMNVRKGLLTLQLIFTLVLIVSTVLLYRQADSLLHADHGFRTENIISVDLDDVSYANFRQEASDLAGVADVTAISHLFVSGTYSTTRALRPGLADEPVNIHTYSVDTNFVQMMDIRQVITAPDAEVLFAAGNGVYLNERAVEALGYSNPQAALGEEVEFLGDTSYAVAGVVTGVHFRPYRFPVTPLALKYAPSEFNYALLRTAGVGTAGLVAQLQTIWSQFNSMYEFEFRLYQDVLQQRYAAFQDMAALLAGAAILAILIACLGLLGIVAYTTQMRVKEIGIRKTFGAGVVDVVRLLSSSYLALFALAAAMAVPLSVWLNARWLRFFADPVEVGVWMFAGCVAALLMLVLIVVSSQTVKAALSNPADCLQYE